MDFGSIIGRLIGGHATHIAGAIGAAIAASEIIKPFTHAAAAVGQALQ